MAKLLCSFHGFSENPTLPTFLSSYSFAFWWPFRREHNTCCEHEREVKKISMCALYMCNFQQYSKPFLQINKVIKVNRDILVWSSELQQKHEWGLIGKAFKIVILTNPSKRAEGTGQPTSLNPKEGGVIRHQLGRIQLSFLTSSSTPWLWVYKILEHIHGQSTPHRLPTNLLWVCTGNTRSRTGDQKRWLEEAK